VIDIQRTFLCTSITSGAGPQLFLTDKIPQQTFIVVILQTIF
jgi:hypothetical protein